MAEPTQTGPFFELRQPEKVNTVRMNATSELQLSQIVARWLFQNSTRYLL